MSVFTVIICLHALYIVLCAISHMHVFVFQTQNAEGVHVPLKHQLLRVIVRVLQYRMILTGEHCVIQIFSPDDISSY